MVRKIVLVLLALSSLLATPTEGAFKSKSLLVNSHLEITPDSFELKGWTPSTNDEYNFYQQYVDDKGQVVQGPTNTTILFSERPGANLTQRVVLDVTEDVATAYFDLKIVLAKMEMTCNNQDFMVHVWHVEPQTNNYTASLLQSSVRADGISGTSLTRTINLTGTEPYYTVDVVFIFADPCLALQMADLRYNYEPMSDRPLSTTPETTSSTSKTFGPPAWCLEAGTQSKINVTLPDLSRLSTWSYLGTFDTFSQCVLERVTWADDDRDIRTASPSEPAIDFFFLQYGNLYFNASSLAVDQQLQALQAHDNTIYVQGSCFQETRCIVITLNTSVVPTCEDATCQAYSRLGCEANGLSCGACTTGKFSVADSPFYDREDVGDDLFCVSPAKMYPLDAVVAAGRSVAWFDYTGHRRVASDDQGDDYDRPTPGREFFVTNRTCPSNMDLDSPDTYGNLYLFLTFRISALTNPSSIKSAALQLYNPSTSQYQGENSLSFKMAGASRRLDCGGLPTPITVDDTWSCSFYQETGEEALYFCDGLERALRHAIEQDHDYFLIGISNFYSMNGYIPLTGVQRPQLWLHNTASCTRTMQSVGTCTRDCGGGTQAVSYTQSAPSCTLPSFDVVPCNQQTCTNDYSRLEFHTIILFDSMPNYGSASDVMATMQSFFAFFLEDVIAYIGDINITSFTSSSKITVPSRVASLSDFELSFEGEEDTYEATYLHPTNNETIVVSSLAACAESCSEYWCRGFVYVDYSTPFRCYLLRQLEPLQGEFYRVASYKKAASHPTYDLNVVYNYTFGVTISFDDAYVTARGVLDELPTQLSQLSYAGYFYDATAVSFTTVRVFLVQLQTTTTTTTTPAAVGECTCAAVTLNGVRYPATNCATTARLACPGSDMTGFVTRRCDSAGVYRVPDFRNCRSSVLEALEQVPRTKESISLVASGALATMNNSKYFGADDVKFVSRIIGEGLELLGQLYLQNSTEADLLLEELVSPTLELAGRLLEASGEVQEEAMAALTSDTSSAYIPYALENLGYLLQALFDNGHNASVAREDATFQYSFFQLLSNLNDIFTFGDAECEGDDCTALQRRESDGAQRRRRNLDGDQYIELDANPEGDELYIAVAYYSSAQYFRRPNVASAPPDEFEDDEEVLESNYINSGVIKVSVYGNGTDSENANVVVKLKKTNPDMVGQCVFWQFDSEAGLGKNASESRGGGWSSEGCVIVEDTSTHVVCSCDHLTSFAVLTSPDATMSRADALALEIITLVGVVISVPCLLLTFIIFAYFRRLRNLTRVILMHLCLNLSIALLIFICGVEKTGDPDNCTGIAVALHFFMMTSVFWMLAEGVQLFRTFVVVFDTDNMKYHLPFAAAVYGGAAVVVIITGIAVGNTGYGDENYCWLTARDGAIWAFLVPLIAVMLVNFILFVCIMREIVQIGLPGDSDRLVKVKRGIKGTLSFSCLLGLGWIFGVVAIENGNVALQYLFTILNIFQGLFIFIFHVVRNRAVREAFKGRQAGYESYKKATSSGTSGQVSGNTHSSAMSGGKRVSEDRGPLSSMNPEPSNNYENSNGYATSVQLSEFSGTPHSPATVATANTGESIGPELSQPARSNNGSQHLMQAADRKSEQTNSRASLPGDGTSPVSRRDTEYLMTDLQDEGDETASQTAAPELSRRESLKLPGKSLQRKETSKSSRSIDFFASGNSSVTEANEIPPLRMSRSASARMERRGSDYCVTLL